jgi:hypothetical protein
MDTPWRRTLELMRVSPETTVCAFTGIKAAGSTAIGGIYGYTVYQ